MSARELITEHLGLWTGAVTKKSSSGRGSNGKVELTGVKKLRELILELAVQGKLVDQNPNDEPASMLLERIDKEKAQLTHQGKLKKPKKYPEVSQEDHPFKIPSSWAWERMHRVFLKITDGTHHSPPNKEDGEFLYVSAKNIKPEGVQLEGITFVTKSVHEEIYSRCNPEPGDLLYIKDGATTGIAAINNLDEPFSMLSSVALLKPHRSLLSSKFLLYCLRSPFFYKEMRAGMTGVAITRVTLKKLDLALIPVPPINEQHRIVKKVDELMTLCDRLEQQASDQLEAHETLVDTLLGTLTQSENATELAKNWARLAAHFDTLFTTEQSIDKLKQTILQLAVMGRLVEQDAEDEAASSLLDRVSGLKQELYKEGKLKKPKKLPDIQADEPPFKVPQSWAWARMSAALLKITDGTHHSPANNDTGDFMYVSAKNIKEDGVQISGITFVSQEVHTEIFARCDPEKGDLLYIKDGATTGIATINQLDEPFSMLSSVALLKPPHDLVTKKYLLYCLRAPFFYDEMRAGMTGVAITRVTLKKLDLALIPIPPVEEQHRIVRKVDELMALCGQLKERLNQASETCCQLANAVVEREIT